MTARLAAVTLLAVALSACAAWTRVEPDDRAFRQGDDYTLELPSGWVRRATDSKDLFITRDGPALNAIVVARQPHDRKLPHTQRETRAGMLPFELAELALAEWKSAEATANLDILSNTPATLGGKPAARLHIRYRDGRGLPIERVMVALVDAKGRFSLLYEAPAIVYFQRGLPAFEAMLASVQFQ